MINLYLIRHGIAADRADYPHDSDRPLTEQGRQKTKLVAEKLLQIGIKFDLILTSPLVRSNQTAEILQKIGLSQKKEIFPPLSPQGTLQDWVKWWAESESKKQGNSLALVGHQPNLGNWAEILVWGNSQEKLIIKKAGIIGLRVPTNINPIGNCEFFLLTSPKWLSC